MCPPGYRLSLSIANVYDEKNSYPAGTVAMINGRRYRSLVDIPAGEKLNLNKWNAQTIEEVIHSSGSVSEYATRADFPSVGEAGKIYIDKSTNTAYRWNGTTYAPFSESIAQYPTRSAFPASGQMGILYVATDTGLCYRWTGASYEQFGSSVCECSNRASFPTVGEGSKIYIDAAENVLYRWDTATSQYYKLTIADFSTLTDLPEDFSESELRTKLNTMIHMLKGIPCIAAALLCLSSFSATVHTARKDTIRSTAPVVTNVTFEGLATTNDVNAKFLAEETRAKQSELAIAKSATNYTDSVVLSKGYTTTNDVCNIVTNNTAGSLTEWTTGQVTYLNGVKKATLTSVFWWNYFDPQWAFHFTFEDGTYSNELTDNRDPNAMTITFGAMGTYSPEVTSTRSVKPGHNALGLAYLSEVPTNYVALATTNDTTLTLTDAQGKTVTFKGGTVTPEEVTNVAEYVVSTNGFVTQTVTNMLASEAWVSSKGYTTTNDVCNIVTNDVTGIYTEWTTGQETYYGGSMKCTLTKVEWYEPNLQWLFYLTADSGVTLQFLTGNSDPDATFINCGAEKFLNPAVTTTRTRKNAKNALGLAYHSELPTDYLHVSGGKLTGELRLAYGVGATNTPIYINSSGEFKTCDSLALYLRSDGGMMAGDLIMNNGTKIKMSDNMGALKILGGTDTSAGGAWLSLHGSESGYNAGEFELVAMTNSATAVKLNGKTDGTLTWGGNDISGKGVDYSSSITIGSGINGTISLWGIGKLRILRIEALYSSSTGNLTIGTVSSSHHPVSFSCSPVVTEDGTTKMAGVFQNGVITIYNSSTASVKYWGTIIYNVN